jgi:phosphoribosyl 1,2-cyclic phosphate phosphodiesterase
LIDTPAEVAAQFKRGLIDAIDFLTFTHLDPHHVKGFRVVEQIALDFRTREAYPDKQIQLILPELLMERVRDIRSVYGPLVEFYEKQVFIKSISYKKNIKIKQLLVSAFPVECGDQTAYIFKKDGRKIVRMPCDIKPFPEKKKKCRVLILSLFSPEYLKTD